MHLSLLSPTPNRPSTACLSPSARLQQCIHTPPKCHASSSFRPLRQYDDWRYPLSSRKLLHPRAPSTRSCGTRIGPFPFLSLSLFSPTPSCSLVWLGTRSSPPKEPICVLSTLWEMYPHSQRTVERSKFSEAIGIDIERAVSPGLFAIGVEKPELLCT
ncbi:hypothetical protein F4777DRAFT_197029 [Nemania sp. FL0916]|nr:hypothetical protein F4777DRAFT_197029 [Nemania sp. FL0916]